MKRYKRLSLAWGDFKSPPVRGAWIETPIVSKRRASSSVASREGGVD